MKFKTFKAAAAATVMKSFDVKEFVKRPDALFLLKSVTNNVPVQDALYFAVDLVALLDKAVAKKDASIFKELLEAEDELIQERDLLLKIWSVPYERLLERFAYYPMNDDDWLAVSDTISSLEHWLEKNKAKKIEFGPSRREQRKPPRIFRPEEMQPNFTGKRSGGNFENQLLDSAIDAKKRILFQLRMFAERHFKYLRGSKRDEFKNIVTLSESILNQKEMRVWRDYLRALIYAEFTVPLTIENWKDIYENGPVSRWFSIIFGDEKIRDQDILLSIKEWALFRLQNPQPTNRKKANKLLSLETKIEQLLKFIEDQAKYERGGDIGLYDAEKNEIKRILGDKNAWRTAVFRHVQTCIACNVNTAFLACGQCQKAAYCGLSCQTKDWLDKHARECMSRK